MNDATQQATETAKKLLKQFQITKPPINVESLATKLKINIEHEELDDDVSGFLIIKKDKSTIVVNSCHPSNRQRFTIAHEIGHFMLHAKISGKEIFVDKKYNRDLNSSTGEIEEEKQANQFAAELLMPEKILRKEIEDSDIDLVDDTATFVLAKKFQVSEQALGYRLAKLDLGLED